MTEELSFAPNQLNPQGAKLVTNAADVIEGLPTPVRAALVPVAAVGAEQRNLLAKYGLTPTGAKVYGIFSVEEPKPIDQLVETTGLNSSEVLATLFNLERKGILRQLPGFVVAVEALPKRRDAPERKPEASAIQQGRVGQDIYIR